MRLELYHLLACSFSSKVRTYIDDSGIADRIEYRDVMRDKEAQRRLRELTGDEQVPCLVVDGTPVLESDEIIAWLRENVMAKEVA